MSKRNRIFSVKSRPRAVWAAVCAGLATFCLWLAFDGTASLRVASAFGDESPDKDNLVISSREGLRSAVDSLAVGLAGIADDPYYAGRRAALMRALDSLTVRQSAERGVYFTAWQGTVVLHSPATPDAAGIDFADAKDAEGRPFVAHIADLARRGGGFVRVEMPVRRAGQGVVQETQIIYSRTIPDSDLHIAAFASERVLTQATEELLPEPLQDVRRGLCVSGFSFAGITGVLLAVPMRRREE